jgi:hypothetical protein
VERNFRAGKERKRRWKRIVKRKKPVLNHGHGRNEATRGKRKKEQREREGRGSGRQEKGGLGSGTVSP